MSTTVLSPSISLSQIFQTKIFYESLLLLQYKWNSEIPVSPHKKTNNNLHYPLHISIFYYTYTVDINGKQTNQLYVNKITSAYWSSTSDIYVAILHFHLLTYIYCSCLSIDSTHGSMFCAC